MWFLPKRLRADLLAIYGYARFVDDIGDEADLEPAGRLELLGAVDAEVTALFAGRPTTLPAVSALADGVRGGRVTEEPLRRLIEANRLDQRASKYETFDDLVHYCTLSADPVGRLVLAALGLATPDRIALSDRICTALQFAEHWQDVAEDRARNRVYLPQDDLRRFGVTDADLTAPHASAAVKTLLAFEVARAGELLRAAPLWCASCPAGQSWRSPDSSPAAGRALHAITVADFDVLATPQTDEAPTARRRGSRFGHTPRSARRRDARRVAMITTATTPPTATTRRPTSPRPTTSASASCARPRKFPVRHQDCWRRKARRACRGLCVRAAHR